MLGILQHFASAGGRLEVSWRSAGGQLEISWRPDGGNTEMLKSPAKCGRLGNYALQYPDNIVFGQSVGTTELHYSMKIILLGFKN